MQQSVLDHKSLKQWFLKNQRDLPWRNKPTPYAVWVSEVMLQQTQVSVVIPYFLRWMQRFPTINDLAKATMDEVIKEWEGLGYYSRARNLHAGAKKVVESYKGKIPDDPHQLQTIKGLGPYTIGAIRSFAFHHKAAAVDGNVLRVIARYLMIKEDISKAKTVKSIREWIEAHLPDEAPWIINEALIELGASVCSKKPQCHRCPINKQCLSFKKGCTDQFPIKKNQVASIPLFRIVAVIGWKDHLLIKRGREGEIMHDLHEFPFFETTIDGWTPKKTTQAIKRELGLHTVYCETLPLIKQTFTKYRVQLLPMKFEAKDKIKVPGYDWLTHSALTQLAFSSGHRKIFDCIRKA